MINKFMENMEEMLVAHAINPQSRGERAKSLRSICEIR